MPTLGDLKPGEICTVIKINIVGVACQRLISMGILPGATIKVIRNAPLLDPIDMMVNKTAVAVRRAEASQIEVEIS